MAHEKQRESMMDYLVRILISTNSFSIVEPEYKFNANLPKGINSQRTRHVYAKEDPKVTTDGQAREYLIVANSDIMSGREFGEKIAAASMAGIHTAHVLYKYTQDTKNSDTVGPLWRRFVLEEAQKPNAQYHQAPGFRKGSFAHLGKNRNALRKLTRFERDLVRPLSEGSPFLYQPQSARLEECLKRFRMEEVEREQESHFEGWRQGQYKVSPSGLYPAVEYMLPSELFSAKFFSLAPVKLRGGVVSNINEKINGYDLQTLLRGNHLLAAEFVPLPDIYTDNPQELMIRNEIALIRNIILLQRIDGNIEDKMERAAVRLENAAIPDDHPLSILYNQLLVSLTPPLVGPLKIGEKTPTSLTIKYESKSHPGRWYTTTISGELDSRDNYSTTCTCPGNRFWQHCWHQKDIADRVLNLDK